MCIRDRHGSRVNLGLLPLLGSGKEPADHRLALFEPGYLVRGEGMPVLLRRDIDLGEREGDQLVGLEVAAAKGFDPVSYTHLVAGAGTGVAQHLLLVKRLGDGEGLVCREDVYKRQDRKAAAVELIYGIWAMGSVDNGRVSIVELVMLFEQMFHIDLGDCLVYTSRCV